MSVTEENKNVVLAFFGAVGSGGDPTALLADDLAYWIAGKPEQFPLAGSHSKEGFYQVMSVIGANMPNGVDVKINNIVAEGDQVVVETEVHGVSATGKAYDNKVVFVFTVRDGKLVSVREYLDTIHANEVLAENVA
ncbi:nuclear transport factor 2 family protein [Streptomyces sp. NPDC052016]|uniref:nuclear transport factor 2 family protein n=1 Tax=Streptomyces sp. NPDC052016 TaxID=3365680 RepID=UPI0037D207A5